MEDFNEINLNETVSSETKAPSMFQITFGQMVRDMKFVGVFIIIYGALNCLSIIGAVVGIPYILIGLRMRESAEQFELFKTTNDPRAMRYGFELQAKYFKILKILVIITLVLIAVSVIIFFAIFIPLLSSFSHLQQNNSF
ncbi:DUF5362 domain-containing protein [Melioribacteraceae bacterium 4301-Me]|uniref:DUF5362 domain-containing protein n=1 Tax=Pyranulibacter aquaticus TaxID=3163344 RepID=UPI00359B0022